MITLFSLAACSSKENDATPLDTASTTPSIVDSSVSQVPDTAKSPEIDTPAPVSSTKTPVKAPKARDNTKANPVSASDTSVPTLRDSAIRPRGIIDEKGNVRPIKRDTLK